MSGEKILVTGQPHTGKSTLIHKLIDGVSKKQGFVSLEVSEDGIRTGFEILTADGIEAILASIHTQSPIKVSKYSVDVASLDQVLPRLQQFKPDDLLYIDEIGQMELYSEEFKKLVETYLNSQNLFIGTITQVYSDEFIKRVLERRDVTIVEMSEENREKVYADLSALISNRLSK